jgi:hypothetical protein
MNKSLKYLGGKCSNPPTRNHTMIPDTVSMRQQYMIQYDAPVIRRILFNNGTRTWAFYLISIMKKIRYAQMVTSHLI